MEISDNQTKNMLNYSDILHVVGSKNFYEENTPTVVMESPPSILILIKLLLMGFIIIAAIFGNLLVIVSVMRHRKLR